MLKHVMDNPRRSPFAKQYEYSGPGLVRRLSLFGICLVLLEALGGTARADEGAPGARARCAALTAPDYPHPIAFENPFFVLWSKDTCSRRFWNRFRPFLLVKIEHLVRDVDRGYISVTS